MNLPADYVASWTLMPTKDIMSEIQKSSGGGNSLIVRNEITPADLCSYFVARFGPPNGIQNFLRKDDSDNLIHWEWVFRTPRGIVTFLGQNFRTEIWFIAGENCPQECLPELLAQIKADFKNYGRDMSAFRKRIEDWTEFVNPYVRIKSSVGCLLEELRGLKLQPEDEAIPHADSAAQIAEQPWSELAAKYSKGLGLCFGIRSMLPVMAEAYVNLVMFVLLRPDIKEDERLREHTIRQPIDIRIKTLHTNCIGFTKSVDYSSEPCRAYHTLVNERNDLLHGNVVLDKLKFSEVYFVGKIPIFKEYRTMWQRTVGVDVEAVGLHRLQNEVKVVRDLVDYINSCLEPQVKKQMEMIAQRRDLGFNKKTGRIGILFADHLVDFYTVMETNDGVSIDARTGAVEPKIKKGEPTD